MLGDNGFTSIKVAIVHAFCVILIIIIKLMILAHVLNLFGDNNSIASIMV